MLRFRPSEWPAPVLRAARDERGFTLVSAMLVLGLLAIFALVAGRMAANDRRTTFNEFAHDSSFLAADSGSEAAIAWLRSLDAPPVIQDPADFRVNTVGSTSMTAANHQRFDYQVRMHELMVNGNRVPMVVPRAGYSSEEFMDFVYDVDAEGTTGQEGRGAVSVAAHRLNRVGY